MDKYYTPELEEFHLGFEYEYKSFSYWTKHSLEDFWICDNDGCIEDYVPTQTTLSLFRVKTLDKEDIESLGWKFIKQHPGTTNFDFEKEGYSLHFDPEFGNKWNLGIYDGEDQDIEFNYFSGYIKNKSELKKLLKQLQIG